MDVKSLCFQRTSLEQIYVEGEPAHKDVSSGSEDLWAATCCKTESISVACACHLTLPCTSTCLDERQGSGLEAAVFWPEVATLCSSVAISFFISETQF